LESSNNSDKIPLGTADDEDSSDDDKFDVQSWLSKISKARQKEQSWRERARKCINIYRDDNVTTRTSSTSSNNDVDENCFNMLWANVETLLPALFSAVPNPDIRNRYLTDDPDTQQAGQVLERCLIYSLDTYNFPRLMKAGIKDYLLTGRSVIRVRLWPEFEDQTTHDLDIDGNLTESTNEVLVGQSVRCELVHWDNFVLEPAKRWEDVSWIDFIHMLTEDEFEKYFPGEPLVSTVKDKDEFTTETLYQVHEVWDKNTKQVYFLGDADEPLKILDDPLRLTHFWPIPEPLYSIQTNDSLVPIPEYTIYQSQAEELNQITYRITDLVKACKLIGVYDSQQSGLADILTGRDSQFFPVQSNLMRSGGMKGIIDHLDISGISQILSQLYHQRDQIKGIIYEVTGISDIIRGESAASETATAQNIKASYAGLRLRDRRDNINRFIVDLLRIKTELISQFFQVDQLQQMSGIQITPQIQNIIQDDILRSYKVDIETDSTILADMDQQAQKRAMIVQSITQFISVTAPMVAQGFLPVETARALLQYALQPTKISRELEDALEKIGQPQPQMQQNPQMQPQPGQMPGQMQGQQPQGQMQGHPQLPPPSMHPHKLIPHGMPQQQGASPPMMQPQGAPNNFPPPNLGGNALMQLLGNNTLQ
jgi:hypothetical protein